jgi:putative ATP-dependent endonuclease of the OLD family
VSVCSVAGTNFNPYVKLLCALGIPFAVITDCDWVDGTPRGYNRALKLVEIIDRMRGGADTDALIKGIKDLKTWEDSFAECETFGIFVNSGTLETELFEGDFADEMIETLRESKFSQERRDLLDAWEVDPKTYDSVEMLKMIEQMGKGRYAQRLATRVPGKLVPDYIANVINHVIARV